MLNAATTGVRELDDALEGLYWGDNVVWETEQETTAEPFYRAIAATAGEYHYAAWVALERSPDELRTAYPGLDIIDARPGKEYARPGPLLAEVRRRCDRHERDLVLFDSLEAMAARWGEDTALRFFSRTCPTLLELGAIAYWSLAPTRHRASFRQEIAAITQCVISLGEDRMRIGKAEARPPGTQGRVLRVSYANGRPVLEEAPMAARLGGALRAVRLQRGLNQTDLARLAAVSPSAVSQAERGQRGLSLETLITLSDRLGITLDELLRGEVAPGYRLARRHDPHERADGRPLPLLDHAGAGLRAYFVQLAPRSAATPHLAHKGVELVAVARGLVQVVTQSGRPVLREREALLLDGSTIASWRNIGETEATLFWILRDNRQPTSREVRDDG